MYILLFTLLVGPIHLRAYRNRNVGGQGHCCCVRSIADRPTSAPGSCRPQRRHSRLQEQGKGAAYRPHSARSRNSSRCMRRSHPHHRESPGRRCPAHSCYRSFNDSHYSLRFYDCINARKPSFQGVPGIFEEKYYVAYTITVVLRPTFSSSSRTSHPSCHCFRHCFPILAFSIISKSFSGTSGSKT